MANIPCHISLSENGDLVIARDPASITPNVRLPDGLLSALENARMAEKRAIDRITLHLELRHKHLFDSLGLSRPEA